ncbi:peptidylprolyl isomerase [Chloroflexota bacterium]
MVKKNKQQPPREITKRQLSRWQKQNRIQRIIFGAGISVIVVALALVGIGWYSNQYQPLHAPAVRVNDTVFNMAYYIKMLGYYSAGQSSQYMQAIADDVEQMIQQNELIRQAALQIGFTVSDKEVAEELAANDISLSKDYREIVRADMLMEKLDNEYFTLDVPESAEHRQIRALFLESGSQVDEVRARLAAGEDLGDLATELSLDSYSRNNNGDFGWRPKGTISSVAVSSVLEDYIFSSSIGELIRVYDQTKEKSLGYWILELTERNAESGEVHTQAMLLSSYEEAAEIKAKLASGDEFATLAEEFSQNSTSQASSGDLGWMDPEGVRDIFSDFLSEAEAGAVSSPIRDDEMVTTGGYWLAEATDENMDMEVDDTNQELIRTNLMNEWLLYSWVENETESYLDEEAKIWAISRL